MEAGVRVGGDEAGGGWEVFPASGVEGLVPVREDYARVSIRDGFDWEGSVGGIGDFRAYLVVFRSVRKGSADVARLVAHDDAAHEEAKRSVGFLYYFKGDVARDRHCLSFCLWESREHAKRAAKGAYHRLAVAITEEMYDVYDLERYEVYRDGEKLIFEAVGLSCE